jgi:heme-degrading monooxygenase HmoA
LTHHRIWKFRPPQGREQEFAAAYGGKGEWASHFTRAKGYRGTSLLRPIEPGGFWLTIDRWGNRSDFDAFQRDFGAEYHALDAGLEGVSGEEEFVGAFEDD